MKYKLGSLFDGSGGFPLAGTLCGIEPVWASEVEPYPIAVTSSRFPRMKHLGDISKINGAEVEPVDIITFGSPCQDLSVAGKRAGLKHEANGDEETTRSGLFMEAVRIIKEMRKATNGQYPRFALWENVPGAFSSNKGEDFRIVCEELIKIAEPSAFMPEVPQKGWNYSDSYVGDGWSLAYRVFDAQYWGVPQRRRRIYLVADFRGTSAREVLFERQGLRGYFAEGRTPWEGTPADAQGSTGADDRKGEGFDGYNGDLTGDKAATLGVNCGVSTGRNGVIERGRQLDAVIAIDKESFSSGEGFDRKPGIVVGGPCATLQAQGGPHAVCYVETYDTRGNGDGRTVNTITGDHENRVTDYTSVVCLQGNGIDRADTAGCNGKGWKEDISYTLNTIDRPAVAYGLDRASFNQGQNAKFDFTITEESQPTLTARGPGAVAYKNEPMTLHGNNYASTLKARDYKGAGRWDSLGSVIVELIPPRYIVRRLTPTECARLQGFADWWSYIEKKDTLTDEEYHFWLEVRNTHAAINGKKVQDYTLKQMLTWYNKLYTDSAEYKMWGNGIALPTALYCVQGVADALKAEEDESWML